MSTRVFSYLYTAMLGACFFSFILWVGMQGYAPFGLHVAYTAEGVGSGLVLSHDAFSVAEGSTGAFYDHVLGSGEVVLMQIAGSVRRDGALWYFNTDTRTMSQEAYPAHALVGPVVMVLPFLGTWVHALTHPVGMMALLGSPLVMLLVDVAMLAVQYLQGRRFRGGAMFDLKAHNT